MVFLIPSIDELSAPSGKVIMLFPTLIIDIFIIDPNKSPQKRDKKISNRFFTIQI